MARQFEAVPVTFRRTVTQEQTITVKVPPELSGKLATEYAEAVATKRLSEDDKAWKIVSDASMGGKPGIVR